MQSSQHQIASDSNCVQILAPHAAAVDFAADFVPGERIGNVDRNVAVILSRFMDDDFDVLLECDCYETGFFFTCTLSEDSHHRRDGYQIKILIYSANNDAWCDKMILSLISDGLKPSKLY